LGPLPTPLSSQDVGGIYQPYGNTHQGGASLHVPGVSKTSFGWKRAAE